jgi:2-polyprenyl-3-methyl-5-hydroxy-6-metoxy-1,4-benzoquinol methylase
MEHFETMNERTINCPVCMLACTEPALYRYTVGEAAEHFCPPTRNLDRNQRLQSAIRSLWQRETCEIYRCRQCGFGFGHPHIGGNEEFYSILHEQKGYPAWRWDYDFAVQEALAPAGGGKILDIGAGVGLFLRRLPPGWQRYAVESSDSNRLDLEREKIQVIRDLSSAALIHQGAFQVVTLFQVLEHISEFKSVLGNCRQLLAPAGRIVITVPDGDAMIRQEKLTGCADMPPNHINKWTPGSLKLALENGGFDVLATKAGPAALKSLLGAMHMRVMVDAKKPRSMAARVYAIQDKRIRAPLVGCLGLAALFRLFPNSIQLMQDGAFGIVAQVRDNRKASGKE